MKMVLHDLIYFNMIQYMMMAILVYMLPIRKRHAWKLRYLLCFLFSEIISMAINVFTGMNSLFWIADIKWLRLTMAFAIILCQLLYALFSFYICCNVTLKGALFGTICAYATQHFVDALFSIFHQKKLFWDMGKYIGNKLTSNERNIYAIHEFLLYSIVFFISYFIVSKKLPKDGEYIIEFKNFTFLTISISAFAMVFSYFAKLYYSQYPSPLFYICMLFDMLCCIFVLWVQIVWQREKQLALEIESERIIRSKQKKQYEIARDSVERINKKCHNLKHQVAAIRNLTDSKSIDEALTEMEEAVMFYDYMVRSGNEVIDTVLTEKSLVCEQNNITWTCMADGPSLDFMEAVDVYTLFSNIIDNAVEETVEVQNQKQRIIAVILKRNKNMVFIQVENYHNPSVKKERRNDFNKHESTLGQVKYIVEKYEGNLEITYEENLSILTILIPLLNTN